jgi:hypothetical protein
MPTPPIQSTISFIFFKNDLKGIYDDLDVNFI